MQGASTFEAELLRASPRSYASHAVEVLVEREPACGVVWGKGSVRRWQDLLVRVLSDLAVSIEFDEPAILRDAIAWQRAAFVARGAPVAHLDLGLEALGAVLAADLPEGQAAPRLLSEAGAEPEMGGPSPAIALSAADPCGRLALRYLEAVLEGRRREATAMVVEAMDGGMQVASLYEGVLLPVEAEAGRMWHLGELTVAEEHFLSETVRSTMSVICQRSRVGADRGRTVVAGAVQGDRHDIGVRGVCDLLEIDGYRAVSLGGDVPGEDLLRAVADWEADVVVLSVTLSLCLPNAQDAVGAIRAAFPRMKVVVGGAGFLGLESLAKKVGAEALARAPSEAVALAGA